MVQITPRIQLATRDWFDKMIVQQEFRSQGHAVDKMAVFYRKGHRVIANLKSENARLREQVRLFECGRLGQETLSSDMGDTSPTKTY